MYDKNAIYEYLNAENIEYELLEHEAVFTMEAMEQAGICGKGVVCKNLFVRDDKGKQHFLITMPGDKQANLKAIAAQLGTKRLSFASAERLQKYLGLTQGSVTPLGILNDESKSVAAVFDEDLKGQKQLGIHPNDNTATIWLSFESLEKIIKDHGNETKFVKI